MSEIQEGSRKGCTADNIRDEYDGIIQAGRRFVVLDGETIDHIHNMEALALWSYLRNKPHNWIPNIHQVTKCFGIGQRKYKDLIAFLVRCNLATHVKRKDKSGKFTGFYLRIEDGSSFVRQCTHENCSQLKKPCTQKTTMQEACPTPPSQPQGTGSESTMQESCTLDNPTESVGSIHYAGKPQCGETSRMVFADIVNNMDKQEINIKTTTTSSPQKADNISSGVTKSSSSFFDIEPLKKYGFGEIHARQLAETGIPPQAISESIANYAEALEDPEFRSKVKSKTGYFLGVMRSAKFFEQKGKAVKTPADKALRYEVENNFDDRYGMGF